MKLRASTLSIAPVLHKKVFGKKVFGGPLDINDRIITKKTLPSKNVDRQLLAGRSRAERQCRRGFSWNR